MNILKYFLIFSLENKRRSKHISRTLNPQWHQTVMFQELHREELKNKMLEITVWDYDRFKTNDFLGEVIIDLSGRSFIISAYISAKASQVKVAACLLKKT